MSHDDHARAENPFTPAEATAFRHADWAAARNIVCLLLGIFIIGIGLYLTVDYFAYWSLS